MVSRRPLRFGENWAVFTHAELGVYDLAGEEILFRLAESAALNAYHFAKIKGINIHSEKFNRLNDSYREYFCLAYLEEVRCLGGGFFPVPEIPTEEEVLQSLRMNENILEEIFQDGEI